MTKKILHRDILKTSSIDEVLQGLKGKNHMRNYVRGINRKPSKNVFNQLGIDEVK